MNIKGVAVAGIVIKNRSYLEIEILREVEPGAYLPRHHPGINRWIASAVRTLDLAEGVLRIGIVIAQIASPLVLLGDPKIQTDRLRMPDVQISIGFRRKARRHPPPPLLILQILFDNPPDKIQARLFGFTFTHDSNLIPPSPSLHAAGR